ncbi:MAG: HEAT repeat domain-containing protein, partial [Acidobacteriota bacterium]
LGHAAYAAGDGDDAPDSLAHVLAMLAGETPHRALRALRIVPLRAAVAPLLAIVTAKRLDDHTYDAVQALAAVPPRWSDVVGDVCRGLMGCAETARRHPWWDSLRAEALAALGGFGQRAAVPLLLQELTDPNPAVVHAAARSLQAILGPDRATARVVEIAAESSDAAPAAYAAALRWMDRDAAVEALEQLMTSGPPAHQDAAQALLSEIGGRMAFQKLRARTDALAQHAAALEQAEAKVQALFTRSMREAKFGYWLATVMDVVVFLLGIGLIALAAALIWQGGAPVLIALTGGGGGLAVLYTLFLANPRVRVVQSVDHLMVLKILFLGYLRQLHQTDQAYLRRLLDDNRPLDPEGVTHYAQLVGHTMREAIRHLRTLS